MQGLVYFFLILEIIMYCDLPPLGFFDDILARIRAIPIYNNIFFSKLLILFLEILVSIGSRPQKQLDFNPYTQVALPLATGIIFFFLFGTGDCLPAEGCYGLVQLDFHPIHHHVLYRHDSAECGVGQYLQTDSLEYAARPVE